MAALACVFASASPAASQILISDTFDVGAGTTADDPGDPLDAEWLPVLNDPSQINVNSQEDMIFPGDLPAFGTDKTLTAIKNGTFGGAAVQLPVDPALTLGVGDMISVSFDLQLWDSPFGPPTVTGSDLGLRWGIYNTDGVGPVIRNGVVSSNASEIRKDPGTTSAGIVDGLGAGMTEAYDGPSDVVTNNAMLSPLAVGSSYTPSFTAERTAVDTIVYSFSINGSTSTVVDVDDAGDENDNVVDFSGGFFAIRNGGDDSQQDHRIDNFVLEITAAPILTGDYNDDGTVDANDYTVWRDNLNTTTTLPNDPVGGTVGQQQYDNWVLNYGQSPAESLAQAIPEPASLGMLIAAAAVMMSHRTRVSGRLSKP